jgi:RimJ/RimL family protein N-acetyltransferase
MNAHCQVATLAFRRCLAGSGRPLNGLVGQQPATGYYLLVTDVLTDRLHLRRISLADFEAHAQITSDPEVMRYIHAGPLSRAEAWWNIARYMGHWQLRGYGMWAVVERPSGQVIGHMGFLNPEGGRGFELGWALAQKAWGKGYALEGTRAAVAHAFSMLDQSHVTCVIRAENLRSIRVAERLGATLKEQIDETGKRLLIYGIVRGAPVAA